MNLLVITLWFLIGNSPVEAKLRTDMPTADMNDFRDIISQSEGKIKVVNFWATWCSPCLKELPVFSTLVREDAEEIETILFSIDSEKMNEKACKVLDRFDYTGRAYLLKINDSEFRSIYDDWTGAVPLTLLYNSHNELVAVVEKELDYQTLKGLIKLENN